MDGEIKLSQVLLIIIPREVIYMYDQKSDGETLYKNRCKIKN